MLLPCRADRSKFTSQRVQDSQHSFQPSLLQAKKKAGISVHNTQAVLHKRKHLGQDLGTIPATGSEPGTGPILGPISSPVRDPVQRHALQFCVKAVKAGAALKP